MKIKITFGKKGYGKIKEIKTTVLKDTFTIDGMPNMARKICNECGMSVNDILTIKFIKNS